MNIPKFIKYPLYGLGTLLLILVAWGLIEPYFIDIEEETATIPNLPPEWEGQRIAQISDFQIGMWMDNVPTMRRIVAKLVEERPAAVLITGDFIYKAMENPGEEIDTAVEVVRPLIDAGIPTYGILGNHDYSMTSKKPENKNEELGARVFAAMEEIGVEMLQNEAVVLNLEGNNQPLYIGGIGSYYADNSQPVVTVEEIPNDAPRVIMMHHPNSFEELPPNTAPLAMAGHTHGGQIRLPFTPEWSWLTFVQEDAVHADGWIQDYGAAGNRLYVNRGVGFSAIPIRINCAPEITYFTLVAGEVEQAQGD